MGVTLVTTPTALTPLTSGFKFKLNLSDSGTHPIYKQAIFELQTSGGSVIKKQSAVRPVGGGDIFLDFRDDVKGLVRAVMPTFGVTGVQNDNTIMKEFRLNYGERIIDVTVPASPPTDSVSNSSNFKVISAANNVYDASLITDMTERILSYRPKKYSLYKGSYDFMWLLGSGTATYTLYDEDGTSSSQVLSAPYNANALPMNLNTLGAPMTTQYMTVRVQAGAIDETYTIDFGTDCQGSQDNAVEIMFIEPLGGRSVALFQMLDSVGANMKFNEVLIYKNITTVADLRQDGGNTMIYKDTYGTFSMTREMSGDPAEQMWVLGFAASGEYHIRRKDINGTEFWAKFIVDSVNYSVGDKTFNASGHLAMPIKGTLQP